MSDPTAWNEDEESLAAVYQTWETEDLVRAVTVDAASYTPEALSRLHRELERRNVATAEHQILLETAEAERRSESLVGVRGWLRFFVVILSLNSLTLLLTVPAPWSPGYSLSGRVLLSSTVLLGLLGLVIGFLLVRRYRWAPRWAIAWLLLNLATGIGSIFFANGSPSSASTLVSSLVWIRYFQVSKRVKATYAETPETGDADLSFSQDLAQEGNPYAPPGSRRVE